MSPPAGVEACVLVSHCGAAAGGLMLAAEHPGRVRGAHLFTLALPLAPQPERAGFSFDEATGGSAGRFAAASVSRRQSDGHAQ